MPTAAPPTVAALEAMITRIFELENAAVEARERKEQVATKQKKTETERVRVDAVTKATQKACRELQRATKTLEEEAARLSEESHTRRSKLTGKFDATIEDITSKYGDRVVAFPTRRPTRCTTSVALLRATQRGLDARHPLLT